MKNLINASLAVLIMAAATGCNVTSSQRPPIAPENVKIYIRPPAKFEEIALVLASSKNAFASAQSLTDSALLQMRTDAAKLGANGILLSGVGSPQVGSVGSSSPYATVYAYGTGTTNIYGFSTAVNTPIFAKITNGMAIYVFLE